MNPCNIISLNKYSHTIESPIIILKKRNFEVIGEIVTYNNWCISLQANGIDEISFDVYERQNGNRCELWDKIIDLSIIEVQGYGHFEIKINLTDSNETIKSITGQSLEVELGQLTLNEFHVNDDDATTMEQTDYNEDDFDTYGNFIPTVFCNFYDTKHSLLHRILDDKAAHWSIGHVPDYIAINKTDKPELATQFQRTFTVDGTTIYDFLAGDVAKESNVVFVFDTYNRIINCYNLEDYTWEDNAKNEKIIVDAIGDDTTIFIDKDNLAQEITISGDSDSVKNCFRISGGDDIITDRIRAVNMNGTNYIYQFSDFQLAEMPTELVTKLVQYQLDMNQNEDTYYGENGIFTRLCSAYDKYYLLESKMMPKVEITETTAKEQYLNMIDALSKMKVGVFLLSSYDSTHFSGITNNVEDLAKIFLDARYSVEIVDGSPKYQSIDKTWFGQFHVYRTIDETDTYRTPETSTVYVGVDDNEVEYARQKVLKALNKTSMLDIDFEVAEMTDQKIKEYFQLYCRSRLQSFYDGYETCISTLAKLTQTTLSADKSDVADELYKKYYNLKNIVYAVFQERTKQVEEQEKLIQTIETEQLEFQKRWNFRNYLGEDLYHIFCMYRRDDEYQNDNYISDGIEDNDTALTKKAKELLDVSKGEIAKSCQLQRSITANLNNLFGMNEFELIQEKFSLFNYIRIGTNDDIFKLRLLGINYDSNTPETIEVIYSENIESINGSSSDVNSILNQVTSISSSFSSTVLQAKSGSQAHNEIVNMRNNGLNAALTRIKSSDDNEVTIGAQGILCKQITDVGFYSDKQTRIIGSGLYITNDNWQSIKACIGETTDGNFGVIADTLCGKITFSDKIIAGNQNGTVTIDGKGITLDGGAITWDKPINADNAITFNAVKGLNSFKSEFTKVLGLGTTTITSDSVISPKIGGGYLYIKDARSTNNTGISVEINPTGTTIPSDIGKKDDTYIFNIKRYNNLIMGVDINGNGYFKGQVTANNGTIGGFTIEKDYIANGTSTLNGESKSVYLGLDGISCGKNFYVTNDGKLSTYSAEIWGDIYSNNFVAYNKILISPQYGPNKKLPGAVALNATITRDPIYGIFGTGCLSLGDGYSFTHQKTAKIDDLVITNGIYQQDGGINIVPSGIFISNNYYIKPESFSLPGGTFNGGSINVGAIRINKDVGIASSTWGGAAILVTANTSANGWSRPSIAFENGGINASAIWFDTDSHFKAMRNDGTNYDFFFNGDWVKLNSPATYNNAVTNNSNVYITSNYNFARSTSSSKRYKYDITDINTDLLRKLYQLPICSYKYNEGYISQEDERYKKDIPGIIVEDLDEILPIAVNHENGMPEMWNSNILIPCLLGLIQDLNSRIKQLEKKAEEIK